jgi:hypothetical protein
MAIDLVTLLLKFVSQSILALLCGTGRFLVEVTFYTIPFDVQALINAVALRSVAVVVAVAITSVGNRRTGKKQQKKCQCNGNSPFHGFVLSRESVVAMSLVVKTDDLRKGLLADRESRLATAKVSS